MIRQYNSQLAHWGGALILLASLMLTGCTKSSAPAHIASTASSDNVAPQVEWQRLTVTGNTITAIGGQKLPYPLVMPIDLAPLGRAGLLTLNSDVPPGIAKLEFTLFFSTKQEKQVIHWAGNMPHQCPVTQVGAVVPQANWMKVGYADRGLVWHANYTAVTAHGKVRLVWLATPGEGAMPLLKKGSYGYDYQQTLYSQAWPEAGQKRYVSLTVAYLAPGN